MAKLFASETAMEIALGAVRVQGLMSVDRRGLAGAAQIARQGHRSIESKVVELESLT
ncbi:hypothetical protein [Mycolicibacterium stellerae]|uniref:hypothetical protein n=1 Tax=Mycolicibacterium stellerae TaxID=2358193 RepID=UPI0013DE109C|nr:hypothetical protein [Mycolicibacterium stellerae]